MERTINNPNLVTKMDVVRALAKKSRLTEEVAKETLENVLEIIESYLVKNKRVSIINFGSFYVEKNKVKFNPGKGLSEAVKK